MTYARTARKQYSAMRRKHGAPLRSAVHGYARDRAIQSNISGLALFLAKYLSGKGNIRVSTGGSGAYGISRTEAAGRTRYDITVPEWGSYKLPLDDKDKYRVYRSGVWHESMHAKHTPEEVFTFGTKGDAVAEPLAHDVINIIEDRRIEDLGVKEWKGYAPERLFTNAFAWSRRMDVGDFWKAYLAQHFDESKGEYTVDDGYVNTRKANMRHEAFLQRLLVGKIKGGREIPAVERDRIERVAEYVEGELRRLEGVGDQHRIFERLADLTRKVIKDLELQWYQPKITRKGESSWDQTFEPRPTDPKDKQATKAGIDDYFDEIMSVEVVCEKCGKHYAKKYGLREGEEARAFKEEVERMGKETEKEKKGEEPK